MKITTRDIKDLYVNLQIQGMLHTTKFWLNKHNNTNATLEQNLHILKIILIQNYFQYNYQLKRELQWDHPFPVQRQKSI
jgi:hypothetical protein